MHDPAVRQAVLKVAALAFTQFDDLPTAEKEAVLITLMHFASAQSAQCAQDTLFHMREAARRQMELVAMLSPAGGAAQNF